MQWTDEQLAIINHVSGHAKVRAVAGSGKSATLIERVARLLEMGFPARRVQALMFNSDAATGFNQRLRSRLRGTGYNVPEVRTFHSLGMRLCRTLAARGYIPERRIESQEWVEKKMASEALEAVLGEKPPADEVEPFQDFISLVKSDIISADDKYPEATEITGKPMPEHFVEAFEKFEELRDLAGIRFYSDMIYDPVMKLLADPELAEAIGGHLDHLVIDEYQDINEVQQALITIIAGNTANVMVVGDVDQCIYEWRGAQPEFLQSLFDADFEDPTCYQLSYTFRFGHRVSLLANHVIGNNRSRDDNMCFSHASTPATKVGMAADNDGGKAVVDCLRNWTDSGRKLSDAAILVRLYGMSAPLELALLKERIPYRIKDRDTVFQRVEARMLFGYLRLAAGRLDTPSPDGAIPTDYIEAMLSQPSLGMTNQMVKRMAMSLVNAQGKAGQVVEGFIQADRMPDWRARKVRSRARLMDKVALAGRDGNASTLLKSVIDDIKLQEALLRDSVRQETGRDRIEVCLSLIDFLGNRSINEALLELDELMAESAASLFDSQANAVTITSIHKSKGLEWPLVILPGMREGGIPVNSDDLDGPRVEAERRLCYVGMTRAKEELLLVHPEDTELEYMSKVGKRTADNSRRIASRFLYEANVTLSDLVGDAIYRELDDPIDGADIEVCKRYIAELGLAVEMRQVEPPKRQGGPVCGPTTPCRAKVGMKVKHVQFGRGVVTEILERNSSFAIRVRFVRGAERLIIAHQAVLEEDDSPESSALAVEI